MIVLTIAQALLALGWAASLRGWLPDRVGAAAPGLLIGTTALLYRTPPVWPTMMLVLEQAAIATAILWLFSLSGSLRRHWAGQMARSLIAICWAGFFLSVGIASLRNDTPLPPLMAIQAMLIAIALGAAASRP